MKIMIGTSNSIKVEALKEIIKNYKFLSSAKVLSFNAPSGVSHQPKSLEETINGAKNRAANSFMSCDLGFGIEDGLMYIGDFNCRYMNICACAIYNGRDFYIGLSSAYKYPDKVIKLVFDEGVDINEAFYKLGLTTNPKIGDAEGSVGILTKGRLTRKDYAKQAIMMALASLDNKI